MLYREENQLGTISLDKECIMAMAEYCAADLEGKAWLANYKGMISSLVPKNSDVLEIFMKGGKLHIRLYIVIRFGSSIKMTTEYLIDELRKNIEEKLEIPVKQVTVVVTGIVSKQIVKRNIEVTG